MSASLYVGDLDNDVGESLLFDIFKQVGPVASIRVCRDAVTRRSLGYAYVNFHRITDAERALDTLNYSLIKGKPCRIMWSHRDPSIRKSGAGNIFIKNLDKTIDNKALYDTFSTFGNILSSKVEVDENGSSKGYGYVHYETQEAAELAVQNVNGMLMNGKQVFVGPFIPRKDRDTVNPEATFTNVFVKNLDESVGDEEFKQMMEAFGKMSSCVVMKDENGKSKGFGFANFEDHEAAGKAVEELNGKKSGEKVLYAGRAQKKAEREAKLKEKLKKMSEERMNRYHGLNLYVKNLDDTIDEEGLKQEFSQFGTITSAKIMSDEKTSSKGFGFVCFSKPEEASKAVAEMNGRMLANKPIYVALHQPKEVRRAQLEAHHAQRQQGMRIPQPGGPGIGGMPAPMYPAGAPVFYAGGNLPPQAQRQAFVYPQQMMQRRWTPQPAQGGPGRPQYQPMPNYGVPPAQGRPQGRQGRNQRNGASSTTGSQNGNGRNGGKQQSRQNKYNNNMRNQNVQPGQPIMIPAGGQLPVGVPAEALTPDPLTPHRLAQATPEERKQMLGDALFPLIGAQQPQHAPKITGMILESTEDTSELLHLIDDHASLSEKIREALAVLAAANELQGGEEEVAAE